MLNIYTISIDVSSIKDQKIIQAEDFFFRLRNMKN